MNRQKVILALLVVVLIVSVIVAWLRMPRQKSVQQLKFKRGASVSNAADDRQHAKAVELRVELLGQRQQAVNVGKNLFNPTGGGQAGTAARAVPTPRVATAPPPPPPTPEEIARKQLAAFRYLGSYSKKNSKVVFLASGEEILTVRVGDMLIPGYLVTAIEDERLLLQSPDGRQQLVYGM
jgi:hypothetical protein